MNTHMSTQIDECIAHLKKGHERAALIKMGYAHAAADAAIIAVSEAAKEGAK